jgi:hypothetical protein
VAGPKAYTLSEGDSDTRMQLFTGACAANGPYHASGDIATFGNQFDVDLTDRVKKVQSLSAISVTGKADFDTRAQLLLSYGNPDRKVIACGTPFTITPQRAEALFREGYRRWRAGRSFLLSRKQRRGRSHVFLMGVLLAASAVSAAVGIVMVLILLSHPPLPVPSIYAFLALTLASSAVALYCFGWFSVTMGGPFPEVCASRNDVGADLEAIKQQYWPLRNACVYSDGSAVEYVSRSVTVLVRLLAGAALVSAGTSVYLRKRVRRTPGAIS